MAEIKSYKSIPIENIKITKLCRVSETFATGIVKNEGNDFYVCGSKMILGSDVILENNFYYIDLVFTQASKDFLKFIKKIDSSFITQINDKSERWYNRSDVSLLQIEHEYVPIVKSISSKKTLKLKINIQNVEFYDNDEMGLPWQLIKKGLITIPLFRLSSVQKEYNAITPKWELVQLMVEMPEYMFDGCQINAGSESDSDVVGDDADETFDNEVDLLN